MTNADGSRVDQRGGQMMSSTRRDIPGEHLDGFVSEFVSMPSHFIRHLQWRHLTP